MNYLCVLDVESTCWDKPTTLQHEIIEIGAVMVQLSSMEEIGSFQSFVRPISPAPLSDFCKKLTTITQADVDSANFFSQVLANFVEWLGTFDEVLFSSWGMYDKNQLLLDCDLHRVPFPFGPEHLNLKNWVAKALGCKPRGVGSALKHQKLKLDFKGTRHRALDDAKAEWAIVERTAKITGAKILPDVPFHAQSGEIYKLVSEFFDDKAKATTWMQTDNPLLGCSPNDMIAFGRGEKLLKFVQVRLDENRKPI